MEAEQKKTSPDKRRQIAPAPMSSKRGQSSLEGTYIEVEAVNPPFQAPVEFHNEVKEIELHQPNLGGSLRQSGSSSSKKFGGRSRAKIYKQENRPFRMWETFEGQHDFWCSGRVLHGPSSRNLWISFTLFMAVNTLTLINAFIRVSTLPPHRDLQSSTSVHITYWAFFLALWAMNAYNLVVLGLSDPGIVPRQKLMGVKHLEMSPDAQFKNYLVIGGTGSALIDLKYCYTCQFYKSPGCSWKGHHRTVHCPTCDSCIQEFDHHCPWLSNCIGAHNYRRFFFFLNTLFISIVYGGWINWTALANQIQIETRRLDEEGDDISKWTAALDLLKTEPFWYSPVYFAMFPLVIAAGVAVGMLLFYHWAFVVIRNSTTYDTIKKSYKKLGYKVDPRRITGKQPSCFSHILMRLKCLYPGRQPLFKPLAIEFQFQEKPRTAFKRLFQPENEISIQYNDQSLQKKIYEELALPHSPGKTHKEGRGHAVNAFLYDERDSLVEGNSQFDYPEEAAGFQKIVKGNKTKYKVSPALQVSAKIKKSNGFYIPFQPKTSSKMKDKHLCMNPSLSDFNEPAQVTDNVIEQTAGSARLDGENSGLRNILKKKMKNQGDKHLRNSQDMVFPTSAPDNGIQLSNRSWKFNDRLTSSPSHQSNPFLVKTGMASPTKKTSMMGRGRLNDIDMSVISSQQNPDLRKSATSQKFSGSIKSMKKLRRVTSLKKSSLNSSSGFRHEESSLVIGSSRSKNEKHRGTSMSIGVTDLLNIKSKTQVKQITSSETSSEVCPPDEGNPFDKGTKVKEFQNKMQFEGLRALNEEEFSMAGLSQSEVRDSVIQIHNNLQMINHERKWRKNKVEPMKNDDIDFLQELEIPKHQDDGLIGQGSEAEFNQMPSLPDDPSVELHQETEEGSIEDSVILAKQKQDFDNLKVSLCEQEENPTEGAEATESEGKGHDLINFHEHYASGMSSNGQKNVSILHRFDQNVFEGQQVFENVPDQSAITQGHAVFEQPAFYNNAPFHQFENSAFAESAIDLGNGCHQVLGGAHLINDEDNDLVVDSGAIPVADNTDQEIIEGLQVNEAQAFDDIQQLSQLSYSETHPQRPPDEPSQEFPAEEQEFAGLGQLGEGGD